ncbi:hypothetical protein WR25_05631 [Diploscapter pachys]|uniref:Uncharacterized protein n=1 Tax=Diploscapter pachys TaxID=2018661 RepID=A0A2A2JR81_9BILA|nr:hypothetical protein WR25_05631 [Diploscapter pachys]
MPSSSAPPPSTQSDAEVSQLKSEVDMLSLKLLRVKAQLENRLKTSNEHVQRQNANVSQQLELDQENRRRRRVFDDITSSSVDNSSSGTVPTDSVKFAHINRSSLANTNTNTTAERDTLDSRLSTVLFSPSPHGSLKSPPTPQPTRLNISIGYDDRSFGLQTTKSGSLSDIPPRKPPRTFAETLEHAIKFRIEKDEGSACVSSSAVAASSFASSSIALLSMCNHEEFVEAIKHRFKLGQCWFYRSGQLFFVNPFNNLSSSRNLSYSVIPTISSSLLETNKACLLLK